MTVPYTFGTATTSIPLSNLDANFNTPITLGNTSIYLGNTTTTIGNLTLTNATISSGNVTITNVSVTSANITTLTSSSITDSGLTSGRVTYAGASGLLTDSANLTFNGTTLTTSNGSGAAGLIVNSTANTPYLRFDQTSAAKFTIGESSIVGGGAGFYDFYAVSGLGQRFWTNAVQAMTLETTGNLTLNVATAMFSAPIARIGTYTAFGSESLQVAKNNGAGAVGSAYQFAINSKNPNSRAEMIMTDGSQANAFISYAPSATAASDIMSFNLQGLSILNVVGNGNVGIGVSNPAYPLTVGDSAQIGASSIVPLLILGKVTPTASGDAAIQFRHSNNSKNWSISSNKYTSSGLEFTPSTTDGGTTFTTPSMVLDTSGNLGLGVTPSAWRTSDRAFEIGAVGNSLMAPGGNSIYLSTNWYISTAPANVYATNGYATRYAQSDGVHTWWNAPNNTSGAGAALSFTQAMTLTAGGQLLVGQTSISQTTVGAYIQPNGQIAGIQSGSTNADQQWITYSTGAGAYRFYVGMAGTIFATSIVITAISDKRLKENIRDIDTGLSTIMALKPRRFDWKEGKGQDKKDVAGFIAQEFEDVFPECVSTSKAGADGIEYKNINHETLIPTLVKAIQELKAEFDAYKATHP